MTHRLNDYYTSIGKITVAASRLEEVVIRWGALLTEKPPLESHAERLHRGLDKNMDHLKEKVNQRLSTANRKQILDLIEEGRKLKNERNESVHGVWFEMFNADTGHFAKVARHRYEKKGKKDVDWDLHTPTIDDLERLAKDLNQAAETLNERLSDLWDLDEDVQAWRKAQGF